MFIIKVIFRLFEIVFRYIVNEMDGIVYLKELEFVNISIVFFIIRDLEGKYKVNCYLDGEGSFRLLFYKLYNNEYLLEIIKFMDYEF